MAGYEASQLRGLSWPASRLGEALEILARKAGLLSRSVRMPRFSEMPQQMSDDRIGQWLDFAARQLAIESEPAESPYPDAEQMIRGAAPALIRLPGEGDPRFLAVLRGGRRRITVISPKLSRGRVPVAWVRDALTRHLEAPLTDAVEEMLVRAGVPPHRRRGARRSVLGEYLRAQYVRGCWLLRLAPGTGFWKQICHARLPRYMVAVLGLHMAGILLVLFNWWIVGRSAFQGYFDSAWLAAWALILLTGVPLQLMRTWYQSLLSIGTGALFKQRLLHGTLQLEPEEIRHQGAGQFLGRVMESEALDAAAVESGFTALMATVDLCMAAGVLVLGAGGWPHALLLLAWILMALLMCWRYYQHTRIWISTYREMTNELVEHMVGHRTRLAQESRSHWHDGEDQGLERYLNLSEKMDRTGVRLRALVSRGWTIAGLSGMAWTFVTARGAQAELAISLGGILLGARALNELVGGAVSIIGVKMAWEQAGPLFRAAGRSEGQSPSVSDLPTGTSGPDEEQSLLLLRDVWFRYGTYGRPVLKACNLRVRKGDRLLLEGPSGGGKSTLAALVAGLRAPESGLMLLRGFDRQTLGFKGWRRRIVTAPQFHENHVLTETFAFNLLMGRGWPPTSGDLEEAETVCRELGLGELLARMPAGLQQMVGESGWQLSHGERSRLFIARALLQKADVIILDESFAALDPENLCRALKCVMNRADTLLVIAHP